MDFHAINKAFKYADFKKLYNFISQYGTAICDKSWTVDDEKSHYHGENRVVYYNYRGRSFKFEFLRGEIFCCGYWRVPLIIGIYGAPVTEEENQRHIRIRDTQIH